MRQKTSAGNGMEMMRLKWLVAVSMVVVMPAHAALESMDDAVLRVVSGQAETRIYNPPPGFVLKLDALSQNLSNSGRPLAGALVGRQAQFLGYVFKGRPCEGVCTR